MFRLILGFVVTEDMQQLHVVTAFQGIFKKQKKLKKMEKVVVYFGMVDNHPKMNLDNVLQLHYKEPFPL